MKKRVFISAPDADARLRDTLIGRARQDGASVQFVDYAVKEAWDNVWKNNCRQRITGCDGMIAIVTRNTGRTANQLWEIACAEAESVSMLLVSPSDEDRPDELPGPLVGREIVIWSWPQIAAFLDAL
jgi:hypothetical protein